MKKILLSLAAITTFTSSLSAANQYTLDNISVTASQGTKLKKEDVPDSVTIITKKALEESRITTLSEALNKLGNIAMTNNGGPGQATSFFVRGMDRSRVLVLIDGVRYNNPTSIGAAAEFSQIMLYNVEQIEIVKGSQTGVWGADASAGVINIITSRAKQGLHGVANVEYGSFDTKIASLQASYATKDFDITMGGLSYNSDSYSAAEPTKSSADYGKRYDELGLEKDTYINKSFNARLGWNITQEDRVEVSVQTINSFTKYDSSSWTPPYPSVDDDIPQQDIKNRFYSASYKHNGDKNDISLQYNYSVFSRTLEDAFAQYIYEGSVHEVKLDDRFNYADESFIRVGTSFQQFEQKEVITDEDKSYNDTAVFLTNYNKFNLFSTLDTIITESLRYDNYNAFDNAFTGKLGIKQYLYNTISISTNIGSGYNIPTIDQLYGAFNPNPNLEPEKTITSDLTIGNDILWITGFYNNVDNLIQYGTPMYTNVTGKSILKGAEVGYKDYYFDLIGLSANYTYLDAKDANGKDLARRPKDQVDASVVYYATEAFDLGINGQYIGERYDGADKAGAQTGKYAVFNLVSNVQVNDYITVYGKIDNITDKYYQVVDGYATAGRSLYLGLTATY